MIIAETERLVLRKFQPDDAEDLHRIYSNPETMKFMGIYDHSVEEERSNIQRHIEKYYDQLGFGLWAAVLKENNRLIGRCGFLFQEIEGVKDLELAYLIDRDYWSKGLATEAAQGILQLGSSQFGFTRIIAVIKPENVGSIRVAEKCGLNYEREIPDYKDFGRVSLYSRNLK